MTTIRELEPRTIEDLQDLIRINIDAQKGLREAAELVTDPDLEEILLGMARTRGANATQLRSIVTMQDEEAEDSGSIKAKLHRWWIDVRASLTGNDTYAILAEAERGEDAILRVYDTVLTKVKEPELHRILRAQHDEVARVHARVRAMRDAYKAKK